ncbi:MAG TPA: hypothetical protein VHQ65_03640 [Thermoanaerobaculia bacterium]|nr:hypothetical protein [Thermoanaerobaculia bacterium]
MTFEAEAGRSYEVLFTPGNVDPILSVWDAQCSQGFGWTVGGSHLWTAPFSGTFSLRIDARASAPASQRTRYSLHVRSRDCDSPAELVLASEVIDQPQVFEACRVITVGSGTLVAPGGQLVLRAGEELRFAPGFRVQQGGILRAGLDPALTAP